MAEKLFVGNIPYDLNENDLKSVFEDGGHKVTEVKIITDRFTGKSRGFGFVSFESETEAEEAITSYNGRQVGGRTLKVAVAKRKERGGRPSGRRGPRRPYKEDNVPEVSQDAPPEEMEQEIPEPEKNQEF